jgi:hypothetical protein
VHTKTDQRDALKNLFYCITCESINFAREKMLFWIIIDEIYGMSPETEVIINKKVLFYQVTMPLKIFD